MLSLTMHAAQHDSANHLSLLVQQGPWHGPCLRGRPAGQGAVGKMMVISVCKVLRGELLAQDLARQQPDPPEPGTLAHDSGHVVLVTCQPVPKGAQAKLIVRWRGACVWCHPLPHVPDSQVRLVSATALLKHGWAVSAAARPALLGAWQTWPHSIAACMIPA